MSFTAVTSDARVGRLTFIYRTFNVGIANVPCDTFMVLRFK